MEVLEYNTNLVTTVVLTDPDGQDWSNSKPYLDGESVSCSVQFWWYHMQGLRMDLSNFLPPRIAQRLLASVLSDSVSVLAVRYSAARPCLKRVPQYRYYGIIFPSSLNLERCSSLFVPEVRGVLKSLPLIPVSCQHDPPSFQS